MIWTFLKGRVSMRRLWLLASHMYLLVVILVACYFRDFWMGLGFVAVLVAVTSFTTWVNQQRKKE